MSSFWWVRQPGGLWNSHKCVRVHTHTPHTRICTHTHQAEMSNGWDSKAETLASGDISSLTRILAGTSVDLNDEEQVDKIKEWMGHTATQKKKVFRSMVTKRTCCWCGKKAKNEGTKLLCCRYTTTAPCALRPALSARVRRASPALVPAPTSTDIPTYLSRCKEVYYCDKTW